MEPIVSTVVDLFRGVHDQFREAVRGMGREQLDWSPGPEFNSIAVLVTHTLGSELDVLRTICRVASDRDRDAEFQARTTSADELLAQLDRADALLAEFGAAITADDLASSRERPGRTPQTGLHWLLTNYGHAREHLAHLEMTMQLYGQR
jgi:hypothetical protein